MLQSSKTMLQSSKTMKALASGRAVRLLTQRARLFSSPPISTPYIRAGLRTSHITPQQIHVDGQLVPGTRLFSTDATVSESKVDFSMMSDKELKELAMKYSLEDNPREAHLILEQLESRGSIETEIRTSVLDSWIKYQAKCHAELKESISDEDSLSVLRSHLKEICHAAERASELLQTTEDPSSNHRVAVLKAWANACEASHESGIVKIDQLRGIPQRAQHLLNLQEHPTVESYNQVLKAWAYSSEHLRASMAEQLFHKIGDPNGETYQNIIRAWCWSKERRCAFTATGHFMRMMRLLETGRSDMEPSLADYHALFRAWTGAEDKNAPSKVQSVLHIIDNAHKKGLTQDGLDVACYRDALVTMSRRVNVPEVGVLADSTLAEMKQAMLFPDTECYGAAILAWNRVATARECDDREAAVYRALELLQEMTKAYHRTTTVTVKPTMENYNHVLEALTISKKAKATNHAETLLTALEDAHKAKGGSEVLQPSNGENGESANMGPNGDSYKYALDVWKNSKSSKKVPRALSILRRMMERQDLTLKSGQSFVPAFSSFLDVCANCGSEQDSRKVLASALQMVEEMKSLGLHSDSTTYTALLGACNNLIPDGHERQKILKNIFHKACDEGLLDQNVLEQFKQAASTYVFAEAVIAHSREVEGMKVVPESWTRQAKEFQANTKEGRQVLPLSIEGKFTFTKAAAEYKMRKLRRGHNQKMLQGGRMN